MDVLWTGPLDSWGVVWGGTTVDEQKPIGTAGEGEKEIESCCLHYSGKQTSRKFGSAKHFYIKIEQTLSKTSGETHRRS